MFGDKQIRCCLDMGERVMERSWKERLQKEIWGMKYVFIVLIVVMASQVCQKLPSCALYIICQLYLN